MEKSKQQKNYWDGGSNYIFFNPRQRDNATKTEQFTGSERKCKRNDYKKDD